MLLVNLPHLPTLRYQQRPPIELLDKREKAAFFTMLDALVSKKKIKDNLTNALALSA